MPVPNEKVIKIHRDSNYTPTWPPNQQPQQQNAQQQQETREWSTRTVTKRVVQSSADTTPQVTQHTTQSSSKSSDLFSNAHQQDRRASSPPNLTSNMSNINRNTSMKSSSLVSKALQELEDGSFGKNDTSTSNQQDKQQSSSRRDSKSTSSTYTTHQTIPSSTPTMEIVPSTGPVSPGGWSMGTDAGGDVPVTYEIVTKADGKKEFQLLLTANNFSPEDLQVKLTDNTLTISGKHEERSPNGAFSQKSFYRSCTIPSGVQPDQLNCSLDSCGRLKITAPVPDPEKQTHRTTKTITTTHRDWADSGVVPSGFKIGPGAKEQVVTVWNEQGTDNNGGSNVVRKEERTSSKTVRTFKTVA